MERSYPWGEPRDDDLDEEEGDEYCCCGAFHDQDELDGVCKCCGLAVAPNE